MTLLKKYMKKKAYVIGWIIAAKAAVKKFKFVCIFFLKETVNFGVWENVFNCNGCSYLICVRLFRQWKAVISYVDVISDLIE